MNTVSGANGPLASMPSARAAAIAGAMTRTLLVAEQAALAGVRIEAGDGDARPRRRRSERRGVRRCGSSRAPRRRSPRRSPGAATCGSSPARCAARRWPASCAPAAASPPCGRQRLQHLGVAGKGEPAAASASLWIGAVTMAARLAARTSAHRPLDAARRGRAGARIDAARAAHRAGRAAGRRPAAPAGNRGGSVAASAGVVDPRHRQQAAETPAARRITATSPTTNAARRLAARNSRATISGPMPQASPIVSASGSGVRDEAMAPLSAAAAPR